MIITKSQPMLRTHPPRHPSSHRLSEGWISRSSRLCCNVFLPCDRLAFPSGTWLSHQGKLVSDSVSDKLPPVQYCSSWAPRCLLELAAAGTSHFQLKILRGRRLAEAEMCGSPQAKTSSAKLFCCACELSAGLAAVSACLQNCEVIF